ncbi:DUF2130 domain-containing protein [Solemya velesiana gill symbiont]|uniref:Caldesmon n=1 Tax=Solemya velesiana gill symbiont TaxID=1918948 RepID=A0A1T2KSX4_9GAMM|nr:DUF2130 domain-containing protein [Solemya velesiana gill symbiont]OOZ35958.1 Caldesmon [Solemya velesiana gill symbiont]
MSQQQNRIECPNCGHEIDVNEILYHQLDEELKKKYNDELAREKLKLSDREAQIKSQQDALADERANLEAKIAEGIKSEKARLEAQIKARAEEELSERIKALQSELADKSEKVKELNKSKSEIERLKREQDELRGKIELETEQKLNARLNEEREKIRKTEENRATLKLSEKDQVINQLKEQLQEAQRKAEQGSMQMQGEVQELAIEDWLSEQFPLDTVEEIKKGAQGADCLQTVNTHSRHNCGTIYYESKRTKNFQPSWIEKFKNDIRDKNANIGVLVTQAMPADMERMGLKDGIWICTFEEFKGLCLVLRESLIQLSHAIITQENKGDKMGMLYDFLTSNEFRLQIEAIVEGFTQMQADLESEKRAMQGIWKKREKQIEKVLLNTNHMYSSIKGIAGSAIQAVPQLEFGEEDVE